MSLSQTSALPFGHRRSPQGVTAIGASKMRSQHSQTGCRDPRCFRRRLMSCVSTRQSKMFAPTEENHAHGCRIPSRRAGSIWRAHRPRAGLSAGFYWPTSRICMLAQAMEKAKTLSRALSGCPLGRPSMYVGYRGSLRVRPEQARDRIDLEAVGGTLHRPWRRARAYRQRPDAPGDWSAPRFTIYYRKCDGRRR